MKFLAIIFFSSLSVWANACDCDSIKGFKDAHLAFKGKVIGIKRVEQPYIRYEVIFQIFSWTKGAKQTKQIVVDIPCLIDACCGVAFEIGSRYQVFAYEEEKRLKTNLCWANSKLK